MFGVRISSVMSLHNDLSLKEMPAWINEISVHNFKKLYEAFKNTFFLRLYMLLATCIEPAAIYNLNSMKVTGVSAAEQKIKTTIFFSSTLGFLETFLVLRYRSTNNRCFNNFFFVEKQILRNSGICSMLTCIINKMKF